MKEEARWRVFTFSEARTTTATEELNVAKREKEVDRKKAQLGKSNHGGATKAEGDDNSIVEDEGCFRLFVVVIIF